MKIKIEEIVPYAGFSSPFHVVVRVREIDGGTFFPAIGVGEDIIEVIRAQIESKPVPGRYEKKEELMAKLRKMLGQEIEV